jgi:hypothetical protein
MGFVAAASFHSDKPGCFIPTNVHFLACSLLSHFGLTALREPGRQFAALQFLMFAANPRPF